MAACRSVWADRATYSRAQPRTDQLLAHAAKTRRVRADTILGAGTVSTADVARGCGCIAEQRAIEVADRGSARVVAAARRHGVHRVHGRRR